MMNCFKQKLISISSHRSRYEERLSFYVWLSLFCKRSSRVLEFAICCGVIVSLDRLMIYTREGRPRTSSKVAFDFEPA